MFWLWQKKQQQPDVITLSVIGNSLIVSFAASVCISSSICTQNWGGTFFYIYASDRTPIATSICSREMLEEFTSTVPMNVVGSNNYISNYSSSRHQHCREVNYVHPPSPRRPDGKNLERNKISRVKVYWNIWVEQGWFYPLHWPTQTYKSPPINFMEQLCSVCGPSALLVRLYGSSFDYKRSWFCGSSFATFLQLTLPFVYVKNTNSSSGSILFKNKIVSRGPWQHCLLYE